MTDLQSKAVKQIDDAVEKANNAFAKAIGEYIIQKLIVSDEAAQKIISGDFDKLLKEITDKARKQAINNIATIPDFEVYEWVNDFYKITQADLQSTESEAEKKSAEILSFDPLAGLF